MDITPYDNFDRYNEEFNRKAGKIALIVFAFLVVTGVSILAVRQYRKKKNENKSGESSTNSGTE